MVCLSLLNGVYTMFMVKYGVAYKSSQEIRFNRFSLDQYSNLSPDGPGDGAGDGDGDGDAIRDGDGAGDRDDDGDGGAHIRRSYCVLHALGGFWVTSLIPWQCPSLTFLLCFTRFEAISK